MSDSSPPTRRRLLSRTKTLGLLRELENAPGHGASTLYLPPGLPPAEIESPLPGREDIPPALAGLAGGSKTGAVLFFRPEAIYLVLPPFPVTEKVLYPGMATGALQSLIQRDYKIALVLVRLGAYAIGIGEGEGLISSKVGTGLIHGRHRKGGSSAHRFERHRDKQIEYFFTRVCRHAREQLEPHKMALDYIVYGGARTTLELLKKQCPFLGRLDKPNLPPLLEIPEPRQAVLAKALTRVSSSTVMEWRKD